MQRLILRGSLRKYLLTSVSKDKLYPQISATCHQRIVHLRLSSSSSNALNTLLPSHDNFCIRHIGPRESDQADMLKFLGYEVRFFFCFSQSIKFCAYFYISLVKYVYNDISECPSGLLHLKLISRIEKSERKYRISSCILRSFFP